MEDRVTRRVVLGFLIFYAIALLVWIPVESAETASIQEWGRDFIKDVKKHGPETWWEFVTFFGDSEFYAILGCGAVAVFGLDVGLRLLCVIMSSVFWIDTLKFFYTRPRPTWVFAELSTPDCNTDFGMPSGHAGISFVVYTWIATLSFRSKPAEARFAAMFTAIASCFLVSISRPILAVHFPSQILAGWLFGGFWLSAVLLAEAPLHNLMADRILTKSPGIRILIYFLFSMALVVFAVVVYNIMEATIDYPRSADADCGLDTTENYKELFIAASAFFGGGAGHTTTYSGFEIQPTFYQTVWWKSVLRFLVTAVVAGGILVGMGEIPDDAALGVQLVFRYYVRYGLLIFWVVGLAPKVCSLCRLTNDDVNGPATKVEQVSESESRSMSSDSP